MNTILIATDFSTASKNASLYGMQLAKAMNAKVILFTAYQVSHPIAALNVQISHYDAMKQMEQKLEIEAQGISNDGSQIETVCDEGATEEAIIAIANEKNADLIIVGMKGSGKNMRSLFGSTTTSLIKASTIPVVVIPEEAKFSTPKNILYASDAFLNTATLPIDQIKWITELFESKLYVVRVVKNEHEELLEQVNVPHELRTELKILDTEFSFPVNTNISDGLNEFIKNKHINMLVMLPHKHEWMERLLVKSETKDMVFHTHIPLLVLPEMLV